MSKTGPTYDLLVIGGGVNGCGIARDAAGRGLSVFLAEQGDLAQATSSASTKLFHGGLRYLEYYEFRLVREALIEREVLLRAMPHISWPVRFVLPHRKGLRPAWLLRLGLMLYDALGGREILPGTKTLALDGTPVGAALQPGITKGFEYSDCWVDDSRLVVLNARDAAARGAEIATRTRCLAATPSAEGWEVALEDAGTGARRTVRARCLVNAGGPWVGDILTGKLRLNTPDRVRLVRGSHLVVRRLFDHDRAYILQQTDGRIVFAIPYEDDFTLIGTTDQEHTGSPSDAVCTPEERDYLLGAVSEYFARPVTAEDVVWTYSGVRPLYDDGAKSATAATRDYVLKLERLGAAPVLNVFGGKITTYRRLAESALAALGEVFPAMGAPWTKGAPLPGGDFPHDGVADLVAEVASAGSPEPQARRLVRSYGTDARKIAAGDMGRDLGHGLTEAEVDWLMSREWARTAEDVLWRRSKLGLRFDAGEVAALEEWMAGRADAAPHRAQRARASGS